MVTGMVRLIDAKELERQIKATFKDSNPVLMGQMLRWVRCQTTIDAVPVVRCKDCKDHDRCEVEDLLVKFLCIENAYCAAGERKDNG